MKRDNQIFIGLRLDPDLLAAVDKKRVAKRLTRSQFIRDAIFEAVRDMGVDENLIYPQDRVGEAKGGRPRKEKAVGPTVRAAEDQAAYGTRESKRKKA